MQDSTMPALGIANYRQEPSDAEQEIIQQKMQDFLKPYKHILKNFHIMDYKIKLNIETYDFKGIILIMEARDKTPCANNDEDEEFFLRTESSIIKGKFQGFKLETNSRLLHEDLIYFFLDKLNEIETIYDTNNS
jgi:hypothetical protein